MPLLWLRSSSHIDNCYQDSVTKQHLWVGTSNINKIMKVTGMENTTFAFKDLIVLL